MGIRVFDHEFPGQSGHAISESGMLLENVTRKALRASRAGLAADTAGAPGQKAVCPTIIGPIDLLLPSEKTKAETE